jgi:hypothetical protein
MISVTDTEEKIRRALPVFDEMVDEGLIALSDVEIIKYTHSKSEETSDETGKEEESVENNEDGNPAGHL